MTIAQDALNRTLISDSCLVIASHARRIEQCARDTETMPDYEPACMSALDDAVTALQRAKQALADKQKFLEAAE